MNGRRLSLALLLLALPAAAAARPLLLVVSGLGGEALYSERFERWSLSLVETAAQRYGLDADRVRWLAEPRVGAARADGVSTKQEVLREIRGLAVRSRPGDTILVVLIGHGTAQSDAARFNLPGPDLSPLELAHALEPLADRRVALVNAAPSSSAFLEALSAPGRVVITATSTPAENQHTRFAGFFVEALAGDAADADKDRVVSLLEAFDYARRRLETAYRDEQRIQTEHPQLDDNADGVGSRLPAADAVESGDGRLAHSVSLAVDVDATAAPERLLLQVRARELVDAVTRLKRQKPVMDREQYRDELESLLVDLALNRRAYRAQESP